MSSNKSIGIWCSPVPGKGPIRLEVHFNYWRIQSHSRWYHPITSRFGDTSGADFVEVGVWIDDVQLVERIHIFIPTRIDPAAICDCSPHFTTGEIAQGIFNEVLSASYTKGPNGPLVLKRGQRIFCRMHNFAEHKGRIVARELKVREFAGGTLCTIESEAIAACRPGNRSGRGYFRLRFRIPMRKDQNPFVENVPVLDRFLLSGYEHVEYLDFRLNDARTLPTAVEQRIAKDQPKDATAIDLVAFLTAVPVSASLSVTHTAFHKMRLLESSIWTRYAEGIPHGMVVYHWKKKAAKGKPIEDFSAFVKLQIRLSGWQVMFNYLLFALIFGVVGNLVASWLEDNYKAIGWGLWGFVTCGMELFKQFDLGGFPWMARHSFLSLI